MLETRILSLLFELVSFFFSFLFFCFFEAGMKFCLLRQLCPEQGLKGSQGCWKKALSEGVERMDVYMRVCVRERERVHVCVFLHICGGCICNLPPNISCLFWPPKIPPNTRQMTDNLLKICFILEDCVQDHRYTWMLWTPINPENKLDNV